jgi:Protein of unknown function (DUF2442)
MLGQGTKQRAPWEGRVELGQEIVTVEVANPPVVTLTFADGYKATFDFQRLLDTGKVFFPLRDPDFFRTAHPGSGGRSLEWVTPDGDEIDLCADALRMEAEGIWDPVRNEWKV